MIEMAGLEVGSWWAGLEAIIEHSLAKLCENYDNLNSIVSSKTFDKYKTIKWMKTHCLKLIYYW